MSFRFIARFLLLSCALSASICLPDGPAFADDQPLVISTESLVSEDGHVRVVLSLTNRSSRTLYQIHPMFHFHHEMVHGDMFAKLMPGASLRLENDRHPPVMRVGRYPLMIMVSYKTSESEVGRQTQMHTDSFYYKEPLVSEVEGEIRADEAPGGPFLRVAIRNRSHGLKNVQMMLHLPPGLSADSFRNMMGFTLRGEEEKRFEIPLRRSDAAMQGEFPVHLMIEYGEMMKHFTGEARGSVRLGASGGLLWAHLTLITLFCFAYYYTRSRRGRLPSMR